MTPAEARQCGVHQVPDIALSTCFEQAERKTCVARLEEELLGLRNRSPNHIAVSGQESHAKTARGSIAE